MNRSNPKNGKLIEKGPRGPRSTQRRMKIREGGNIGVILFNLGRGGGRVMAKA